MGVSRPWSRCVSTLVALRVLAGCGGEDGSTTGRLPPSTPRDLRATLGEEREAELSWSLSIDDTKVESYRVYRNDKSIMMVPSQGAIDTMAPADRESCYTALN